MNDEFLYRLREDPPHDFALQLKARLDRQAARRLRTRARYLHGFGIALLLGGAAYAITSGTLRDWLSGADVRDTPVSMPEAVDVAAAPGPSAAEASLSQAAAPAAMLAGGADAGIPTAADAARSGAPPRAAETADQRGGLGAASRRSDERRGGSLRGRVHVVGTPGTEPHTESALRFFERYDFDQPIVDVRDEQSAFGLFCQGSETDSANVLVTFSRMPVDAPGFCAARPSSMGLPHQRPVELVVGYEAVVLARSALYGAVELPARAVFLALAREVPDPRGVPVLVRNPYRAWYEIDPELAYDRIELIGPALEEPAARDLLARLMQPGCRTLPLIVALAEHDPSRYGEVCGTVRPDGIYAALPSSAELVLRLETQPHVFGVLSVDAYLRNAQKLGPAALDGVVPNRETLADGTYPTARTLYVYVNAAPPQAPPGTKELAETYLRLPHIARALVAPDETKQRELWMKLAELGGRR